MDRVRWALAPCVLTCGLLLACDGEVEPEMDAGEDEECPAEGVPITGEIDEDTRWSCPTYLLQDQIFVVDDATLTIDPGTTIYGDTLGDFSAALIVTRGARLIAEGTADAPIVFTSGNPEGARATGDWAGVALLGSATANDGECVDGTDAACSGGYLQDRLEGIDPADVRALYGGRDDASSCGSLRYVRIEFAGRELTPDNELNGLTLGGCGSGTTLSYVQVHRGKDDGIEFFGGTAPIDHAVISGASDDSLDFDEGWRGNGQFIVIHQYPGVGDRGIEADNFGSDESATPVTRPNLWNVTMVGTDNTRVALFREGVTGILGNFLISGFGAPIDVRAVTVDPATSWPDDFVMESSVFHDVDPFSVEDMTRAEVCTEAGTSWSGSPSWPMTDGSPVCATGMLSDDQIQHLTATEEEHLDDDLGFDEAASWTAAERSNTFDVDPMLGSTSPTDPGFVPAGSLPAGGTPRFNEHAPDGFGDASATFVGAFDPAGEDWTAGWTAYPAD
ncbi:MAG TPA: hypothetical protein RMH99_19265 [Sandaracinaceae bacterium LLY-WYZ-13_1]|nr:hypothetical protein [Sandaracinaceae bacterium LLY-WYZ-13_1]